ncbi:PREDICTED: uncharacterized protein LOC109187239 [Ipomoea nil]|uniref:uncharacterized protein LOC109187239 n=1 Tax=Ipomoea nil TaxID=35883 RepID=UPI000900F68B|nr:PREDICTED: uncharacterized protein LOC109187239 [Ipomoea nil]
MPSGPKKRAARKKQAEAQLIPSTDGVSGSCCIVKDEKKPNENETPEQVPVIRRTGRARQQPSYLQDYHCHLPSKTLGDLSEVLVCDTGNAVLHLVPNKEDETDDIESSGGVFVNPSEYPLELNNNNAIEAYGGGVGDEVEVYKVVEMLEQIECLVQEVKGLVTKHQQ